MNILLYMVQILSLLQLNFAYIMYHICNFFSVWYRFQVSLHFPTYICFIYTFSLPYDRFQSFLLFISLFICHINIFSPSMVQISSFLLINLLISVPSIHFLAYMVQIQGFHDNYSAYTTTFSIIR